MRVITTTRISALLDSVAQSASSLSILGLLCLRGRWNNGYLASMGRRLKIHTSHAAWPKCTLLNPNERACCLDIIATGSEVYLIPSASDAMSSIVGISLYLEGSTL